MAEVAKPEGFYIELFSPIRVVMGERPDGYPLIKSVSVLPAQVEFDANGHVVNPEALIHERLDAVRFGFELGSRQEFRHLPPGAPYGYVVAAGQGAVRKLVR